MTTTVLVTGGAGYIGSHIVAALAAAGREPILLDDFSNSDREVVARLSQMTGRPVTCIEADVRDIGALRDTFRRHPIAAVDPLRRTQGGGRGRDAAARVLRRQRRRLVRTGRGDGRGGRRRRSSIRAPPPSTASPTCCRWRRRAVAAAERLRAHQARRRGLPARPGAREPNWRDRDPPLLQSRRRASVGAIGEAPRGKPEQPRAAAVPDRRRRVRRARRSSAATGRRRTAPACATTSTSTTSRRDTSPRSTSSRAAKAR